MSGLFDKTSRHWRHPIKNSIKNVYYFKKKVNFFYKFHGGSAGVQNYSIYKTREFFPIQENCNLIIINNFEYTM